MSKCNQKEIDQERDGRGCWLKCLHFPKLSWLCCLGWRMARSESLDNLLTYGFFVAASMSFSLSKNTSKLWVYVSRVALAAAWISGFEYMGGMMESRAVRFLFCFMQFWQMNAMVVLSPKFHRSGISLWQHHGTTPSTVDTTKCRMWSFMVQIPLPVAHWVANSTRKTPHCTTAKHENSTLPSAMWLKTPRINGQFHLTTNTAIKRLQQAYYDLVLIAIGIDSSMIILFYPMLD